MRGAVGVWDAFADGVVFSECRCLECLGCDQLQSEPSAVPFNVYYIIYIHASSRRFPLLSRISTTLIPTAIAIAIVQGSTHSVYHMHIHIHIVIVSAVAPICIAV